MRCRLHSGILTGRPQFCSAVCVLKLSETRFEAVSSAANMPIVDVILTAINVEPDFKPAPTYATKRLAHAWYPTALHTHYSSCVHLHAAA